MINEKEINEKKEEINEKRAVKKIPWLGRARSKYSSKFDN